MHFIIVNVPDGGLSVAEVGEGEDPDWVARVRWGAIIVDYGPFADRASAGRRLSEIKSESL